MNGTLNDSEVCFDTLDSEEKVVSTGSGVSVVSVVTIGKVVSVSDDHMGMGLAVILSTLPTSKFKTGLMPFLKRYM